MDPRRLVPALAALACACVVLTAVVGWARSRPDGATPPPAEVAPAAPTADAAAEGPSGVLAAWDRRRSAAWATGDVSALRRLYVPGSRAGAADVALLRRYLARGLRVDGLTTQVLALRVVERSPDRLVLRTTDRVVGAVAVGPDGAVALPVARPGTREVVLARSADGGWRVVEATGQDSAAASTSRTSSSSKS